MRRDEALRRLRAHEAEFRAAGVAALYLFGSTARDEGNPLSDVDLMLDIADEDRFGLLELVRLNRETSEFLCATADILPREAIQSHVLYRLTADAIRVF